MPHRAMSCQASGESAEHSQECEQATGKPMVRKRQPRLLLNPEALGLSLLKVEPCYKPRITWSTERLGTW